MRSGFRRLVACAVVVVFMATIPATVASAGGPTTTWVVLVCLNGDTGAGDICERDALHDLDELQAATHNRVATYAMIDLTSPWAGTTNSNVRIYNIVQGTRTLKKDCGEMNMGSPDTLSYFINWAKTNVKYGSTTKWALVLMDHGSSWRGVMNDATSGDDLHMAELQTGLNTFKTSFGKNLDILGFDACIMQSPEVLFQIKDVCNYVVASENLIWGGYTIGGGWPFDTIITRLSANFGASAPTFASYIVDEYRKWWEFIVAPQPTLSAWNQVYTLSLMDSIDNFAFGLRADLPAYSAAILAERNTAQEMGTDFVDLLSFVNHIDSSGIPIGRYLSDGITGIRNAMASGIVAEWHDAVLTDAHGMHIYFPPFPENYNYDQTTYYSYATLAFSTDPAHGAPDWNEVIRQVLGVAPPPPPIPIFADDFEDHDISDWTVVRSGASIVSPDTTKHYTGLWSMHISFIAPDNAYATSKAVANWDTTKGYTLRLAYYVVAPSLLRTQIDVIKDNRVFLSSYSGSGSSVVWLQAFSGSSSQDVCQISTDAWHLIEIHASNGGYQVWVDGSTTGVIYAFYSAGSTTNTLSMGLGGGRYAGNAYWDDIALFSPTS